MRASLADCKKILWVLALGAALGCGHDEGPSPTILLTVRGQIASAAPSPVPVAGAVVALRTFLGLESSKTLAEATTDQAGRYQLTYPFTSACTPSEQTGYWIDVSAAEYESTSTISSDNPFSDPPIYCTKDPQVINLAVQPLGWLLLITSSTGSGLDPDGYSAVVTGRFPYPLGDLSIAYPMGVNAEQILPLLPGQFTVELSEVTGSCTVAEDNPRIVTVAPRDTVASTFEVTCMP